MRNNLIKSTRILRRTSIMVKYNCNKLQKIKAYRNNYETVLLLYNFIYNYFI